MTKRILLTVVGLIVVIGVLAGIKALQIRKMVAQGASFVPPPETVTAAQATRESWESVLTSVGSLTAVQGVTVAAELAGKVVRIAFESGASVREGDLLVQQDISSEQAALPGAEATVTLARADLARVRDLRARKIAPPSDEDAAVARLEEAKAAVDEIRAAIAKKTIRAPFAGRLGIRLVNLGQMLHDGDEIVSLQALDPIFVNFLFPQQRLTEVRQGLVVRVTSDALPGRVIEGKITAINPEVDAGTRNVRVQATIANPEEELRPGMFVNVAVVLPGREPVLTIPATAVLYAPYSDSVFVVEEKKSEGGDNPGEAAEGNPSGDPPPKVLRQQFIRLGEQRGDFVAVVSGLEEGDTVVTSGVFKYRNGQAVVIDNTLSPEFQLNPTPEDS
ncbi:MAG: efflux RND transporter periplasmic adaptor subunit [Nitrospirota bacterium]|jgi:membrane fusion protein (multidrug efflux system)